MHSKCQCFRQMLLPSSVRGPSIWLKQWAHKKELINYWCNDGWESTFIIKSIDIAYFTLLSWTTRDKGLERSSSTELLIQKMTNRISCSNIKGCFGIALSELAMYRCVLKQSFCPGLEMVTLKVHTKGLSMFRFLPMVVFAMETAA